LNYCQGGKSGANISLKSEPLSPAKQSQQQQQQPNIPKQKLNVIKERNFLYIFYSIKLYCYF